MKDKDMDRKPKDGFQKIAEIIDTAPMAMMATRLLKVPFSICPMKTLKADPDGRLYFLSGTNTEHYEDITEDNRVQLLYSDEEQGKYISVYGKAAVDTDRSRIEALWDPDLSAWFDGKDDPDLVLLEVSVESAQFWDADQNRLLPLIEGAGVIAPDQPDNTESGGKFGFHNH